MSFCKSSQRNGAAELLCCPDKIKPKQNRTLPAMKHPIASCLVTLLLMTPIAGAQVNIALGALVTSSAATYGGQVATNITDGNLTNQSHPLAEFGTLGFTYTIDLGDSYNLVEIVLWNRVGCCPERLSNYRVSVHPDDGAGMPGEPVWTTDIRTDGTNSGDGGSDNLSADLDPDGNFAGRFITVENLSDQPYNPQIAELQAFTNDDVPEPPVNLALNAPAEFFTAEDVPVGAWGDCQPRMRPMAASRRLLIQIRVRS